MNTIQMYDAQADTINVEEIAINENNRIALDRIKGNDGSITDVYIQREHDEDWEDWVDYVPEGTNDMGWLGYFIGMNKQLTGLNLTSFTPTSGASVPEVLEPFFMGLKYNKSIRQLNFEGIDLFGGKMFTMMGPFFENCPTLNDLTISDSHLGDDGWRLLALAIGSSSSKSLRKVYLSGCNISDEGSVDIITSLSLHPHLQNLWWNGNRLSTKGCMTLATLLRCSATKLKCLYLDNNEIDDEGIDTLVPALKNCCQLRTLYMNDNASVTTKGWQKLASTLAAPNSNHLTLLSIQHNIIDEEALAVFANALMNNQKLEQLYFNGTSISVEGQVGRAFSKLLCDTSSINATFLSNHTLRSVSKLSNMAQLKPNFKLNGKGDKKEIAIIKILQNHNDFDMMPFFEWEFKVLPLMIDWFERASAIKKLPTNFQPNIGSRKLSSVYQFVRGIPLLYVETRIRKELEDIKASESQMEKEHLLLRQEQLMLDLKLQRLRQRRQSVKDRKESLLDKLA